MKPVQIIFLGLLAGLGSFAIEFYLPAQKIIAQAYEVSLAIASLNISLFFLGMAVGQFMGGPLSDANGRRPVAIISLLLFILASLLASLAPTVNLFILLRCTQAVAAGALAVLANAIISDYCDEINTARMISLTTSVAIFIRVVSPIAGGHITANYGWQAPLLIMALLALLGLIYLLFWQTETHPKEHRVSFSATGSIINYASVLKHRRARKYIVLEVLSSIGLFAYVTGSALLFMDDYQLSSLDYGYLFAAISVVLMLSAYANHPLVGELGIERMMAFTIPIMLLATALLTLLCLLQHPPLWLFCLLLCVYLAPMMMTRINATAAAIKCCPTLAGTTASLISTLGFVLGGLTGIVIGVLYEISAMAVVFILLFSASLSFIFHLLSEKGANIVTKV